MHSSRMEAVDFTHPRKGAAYVRNGNGAAYNQSDIQRVDDFFALPAFFAAAHKMIGDAIVAAEDRRGHESEKLFGLCAEGARLVGLMVQGEKTLHAEMAAGADFFVQLGPKFLKIFQAVPHPSSRCHDLHTSAP